MLASNRYFLPVPKNALQGIDRNSSPAHAGRLRNAVDFIAPEGTPVLAAADGMVTFVKDDSDAGGPGVEYWHHSNFIAIQHPRGEYTRYDHLAHKSSSVRPGQSVTAGQQIARIGMTGYTYLPHLHFQVFVFTGGNVWTDFDTLEVADFA